MENAGVSLLQTDVLPPLESGLLLSAILAVIYGFLLVQKPQSNLKTIIKTLTIGSLALLSWQLGGPVGLVAALGLSALGDFFLALDGKRYFLPGLGSFLLAHGAYGALFWSLGGGMEAIAGSSLNVGISLVIVVLMLVALVQLLPHLGELKLPVIVYILAIATMGITSLSLGEPGLVFTGVILFMISDYVLAQEQFVLAKQSPWRKFTAPFLWMLYWAGQTLIMLGVLMLTTGLKVPF